MRWPVFLLAAIVALGSIGSLGCLLLNKPQSPDVVASQNIKVEDGYFIGSGSYSKNEVKSLGISWVGGEVRILSSDSDNMEIKEDLHGKRVGCSQKLHWKIQDGKLTLAPVRPGESPSNIRRDLTIYVPKKLESVTLGAVATKVSFYEVDTSKVYMGITACDIDMSLLNADEVNVDGTASNVKICLLKELGAEVKSRGVATKEWLDGENKEKYGNGSCKINFNGTALDYKIFQA